VATTTTPTVGAATVAVSSAVAPTAAMATTTVTTAVLGAVVATAVPTPDAAVETTAVSRPMYKQKPSFGRTTAATAAAGMANTTTRGPATARTVRQ